MSKYYSKRYSILKFLIKKSHFAIFLIILLFNTFNVFSQTDCSSEIKESADLFNKGMFRQVIEKLTPLKGQCDVTKSEEQQMQMLIIASYMEMDEIEEADVYTKEYLRKNPNIIINRNTDPHLFIKELETFKVRPVLRLSLNVGMSKLMPDIQVQNRVWESADYTVPYEIKFRPCAKLGLEWNVFRDFSLKIGAQYSMYQYKRKITANSSFSIEFSDKFDEICFPLELRYTADIKNNISPFVFVGAYYSLNTNETASITASDTTKTIYNYKLEAEENGINPKMVRNSNNYGYMLGCGLNYTFNRTTAFIEASYRSDLLDFSKKRNSDEYYSPYYNFYFTDDQFKFNHFDISLGFAYTFLYRIKKKY